MARHAGLVGLAAVAAVGLVAACGSAGTGGGSGAVGTGAAQGTAASHHTVISVRKVPGVGAVLVDRSGKTLYSPQQEASGKIACTGSCLSFWFPVRVAAGSDLRAPSGVTGALSTIHRPALTQLTYNGKPLYTFRLDQAPGQAHGNDFTDHFGGTTFTWHALTASGASAQTGGQQGNPGGYSYQSSTPGY
jgi:predicted lipoprotein with Yx(FWY)xxD motif